MKLISTTHELDQFVEILSKSDYVTVDTEFIRDSTYWPRLCLIQAACDDEEAAIDALSKNIDLQSFYDLMANDKIVKVFHAARQDVEIFVKEAGVVPHPMFDTQVAAMVCGFGDQVGYETLCRKLLNAQIDKTSRFTDWSNRPLSEKQLKYALSDVTHLRDIYKKLEDQLNTSGRHGWLDEEMAVLENRATYVTEPNDAWKRLKPRTHKPKFLAVMKSLASWREKEAQKRDMPRNRILKDDAILEICAQPPKKQEDLKKFRAVSKGLAEGKMGPLIFKAVQQGLNMPENDIPDVERPQALPQGIGPTVDLLKVALKKVSEDHHVASRLIASSKDLELIAAYEQADVPALHGWRRELFGNLALQIKSGQIALAVEDGNVRIVPLTN